MTSLRKTRTAAALLALAAALAGCGPDAAASRPTPAGPHHCRIVWTESPHTRALIAWSTPTAAGPHVVRFGTGDGPLDTTHEADRGGRLTGDAFELYYHHAELTGLAPSTTYRFVLDSGGVRSREFHFTTAPADDRPFAILSGGDSRSDPAVRREMNRRIAELATDPDVIALAHGGDYVYSGVELELWRSWLDDHELTIRADGRVLPIIPVRGNHEAMGPQYDEVFGTPGGAGRNYFTTRIGSALGLVTLNTNIAAGGDQAEFVAASLRAMAGLRWRVVQYHAPIYPAFKEPSAAKPHWLPLFEQLGVQLVLENDGHVLKRTLPIRGEQVADDGIVYIGEGGLGVRQRSPKTERWYLQPPGIAMSAHHVWKVRFSAGECVLEAFAGDGRLLDRAVIRP